MKNPMGLSIEDLAEIVCACEEKGVAFLWQLQPMAKNEKPEEKKESDSESGR